MIIFFSHFVTLLDPLVHISFILWHTIKPVSHAARSFRYIARPLCHIISKNLVIEDTLMCEDNVNVNNGANLGRMVLE